MWPAALNYLWFDSAFNVHDWIGGANSNCEVNVVHQIGKKIDNFHIDAVGLGGFEVVRVELQIAAEQQKKKWNKDF